MNHPQINLIITGILLLIIVVISIGCHSFFSNPSPPTQRKIAENVQINTQWTQIKPEPPLKTVNKIQFIGLKIDNIKTWKDENQEKLLLENGTELTIDIQLIDAEGKITTLFPNGLGEFIEFGKRTEDKSKIEDAYFEIGENFTEIRLRSDKQILTKEIIWSEFRF
jgi:hypothetical protein